jgi:hypothetical protein
MSDISTKRRFPNLGKLSIALLEHTVKPIIGDKAIDEIKSPVVEKDLINSLEIALEKAEKHFISEYGDKEICKIVLNLPLSNLPSVMQAVRIFYSSPNDPTLGQVLSEQLKASYINLPSERIDSGIFSYIRFLRAELANLSGDVREKLAIHATFNIQDNTARMANSLDRVLERIEKDDHQPRLHSNNFLIQNWDKLDPDLQDAFTLAYNQAQRNGRDLIKTKDLFAAIKRLHLEPVDEFLQYVPEGAFPKPIGLDISIERNLLEGNPALSGCVDDSLRNLSVKIPGRRKLSSADILIDIAEYGTGSSVAKLRQNGITKEKVNEIVNELGLDVVRR